MRWWTKNNIKNGVIFVSGLSGCMLFATGLLYFFMQFYPTSAFCLSFGISFIFLSLRLLDEWGLSDWEERDH